MRRQKTAAEEVLSAFTQIKMAVPLKEEEGKKKERRKEGRERELKEGQNKGRQIHKKRQKPSQRIKEVEKKRSSNETKSHSPSTVSISMNLFHWNRPQ